MTKMLPSASQPTSVGRLKMYFPGLAGSGAGAGGARASAGSGLRPMVITTRPSGLNLMTMLEPSSTAQMLSCGSTRTA